MIIPHRRWLLTAVISFVIGCASTGRAPRIIEVDRPTARSKEFYVTWVGDNITLVKFEYRQINAPAQVFSRSYVPTERRHWNIFAFTDDDYQKNGSVSAWRVTLWRDQQQLAEKKSGLW